jgi:hypothetical protein
VAGDDHALIAGATLALLRLGHVVGRAHHQHPIGVADAEIHEAHHIGAVGKVPLIQGHVHAAPPQPLRQQAHPGPVGLGIVGIGEEHPRCHAGRIASGGAIVRQLGMVSRQGHRPVAQARQGSVITHASRALALR